VQCKDILTEQTQVGRKKNSKQQMTPDCGAIHWEHAQPFNIFNFW